MSFSYSSTLDSDRDKVRLLIGDTEIGAGPKPEGANLTDEEIDALLTMAGSWQGAAALACRALAAAWANEAQSVKIGPYAVTYSDRAKLYSDKAAELEGSAAAAMGGLWSYHGYTASGDAIGHMFGKRQWGANPTDWTT